MENTMRTYYAKDSLRLAGFLIAASHPFHYDGYEIEFDASVRFMCRMFATDRYLRTVAFQSANGSGRITIDNNEYIADKNQSQIR